MEEIIDLEKKLGKVIDFFRDTIEDFGETEFGKYIISLINKLLINAVSSKAIKSKRDLAIMITRYY